MEGVDEQKAVSGVRHLRTLSRLFERAADVMAGSLHLGKPLNMVQALVEVMRGKLARGGMTPADMEAVPILLVGLGAELLRAVT